MANTAVFGIYSTQEGVEAAVAELKEAGFRSTDISVLLPRNMGNKDLATSRATKAPEGVAAGAGSGALIGGTLGWLVGIGALAIPGVGPLLAAGPIVRSGRSAPNRFSISAARKTSPRRVRRKATSPIRNGRANACRSRCLCPMLLLC